MEQSKALQGLIESADLVRMLEDLTSPTVLSSISAASMAGVRVTLKNVRESILASHDALAAQVIQRARVHLDSGVAGLHSINGNVPNAERTSGAAAAPQAEQKPAGRHDLRASLERMVESPS